MKIKCVAPWAGGKRKHARRIVAELYKPHRPKRVIDLFTGGCSLAAEIMPLVITPSATTMVLNDMNPRIVEVLRVMKHHGQELVEFLKPTYFDRGMYDTALAMIAKPLPAPVPDRVRVKAVAAQLIVWWMGPSGLAGTNRKGWFAQRHSKTGGCPSVRWESFKNSVPELCKLLTAATITLMDFRRVFDFHGDDEDTAIYADPPYLSKTFKYEIDFTDADHDDLARLLNERKRSRVVISYRAENAQERQRLEMLYPPERWEFIELEGAKNMAHATGKAVRNTELLIINRI